MRFVPTLSVEWSAGGLRFRLEVPEQDLAEPLLEEVRHPLDEDTLRALEQSADALLRGAESAGFPDEARARGAVLYRTLVPSRLRPRLRAVRGPLLVSTSLYGMPWELLHDDEEFWGLRYGLGKRLVMDRPLPAAASARLRPRPRALVIGSDPRGDLRFVGQEVEAICEALEPIADIECVSGRLATFDAVTAYLGQSFDLIHYCGHLVASAGAKPALLLAEEQTLSAGAIEANVTGRPLVFLNACASARGEERPGESAWEATASSVVYGFLFGGAVAVVGTLCEVADRHAAALAAAFYRGALERVPIGEALRAARGECRAHPESASSPTWLSAVLYGNPAQVLLPGPAEEREPVRSVVPAAAPVPRRAAWPALRWTALLVLVLAVVAGVLHLRSLRPPQPLVVGVMEVRSRGPNVPPWMRELTRDGLNTILREFGQLRVYARQKIDFVREKRGLTEIEAAETLGMSKMLSATIDTDGAVVTLDLEVIDVSSGLLEASERVRGPQEKFMELQTQLAIAALRALGVEPTADQVQAIVASRGNETLDAYRLLKDTLGEPVKKREAPKPPPPTERAPGTSWFEWRGLAYAGEREGDDAAIQALLRQYAAALEAKRVDQLAGLQVEMGAAQRASLQRYFDIARDLHVRISDVDLAVEGDEALATFTREDTFIDVGSGRRMRLEVRISGILTKQQGAWKIQGLRDPE
jgi:hypothetical protein